MALAPHPRALEVADPFPHQSLALLCLPLQGPSGLCAHWNPVTPQTSVPRPRPLLGATPAIAWVALTTQLGVFVRSLPCRKRAGSSHSCVVHDCAHRLGLIKCRGRETQGQRGVGVGVGKEAGVRLGLKWGTRRARVKRLCMHDAALSGGCVVILNRSLSKWVRH